jgi:hypothetical protein
MNFQNGIYVDAQKGFIKNTNRCSKHHIVLNELFQDMKEKNKNCTVTAIVFPSAFDSVPHDLIMSTLKQLNFRIWVREIIKDMCDTAKSTTEDRGKQTGSIMSRKRGKQGYPLSMLLFNLCLEPLLEATKKNENI